MRKVHYIVPRQVGKTTKIVEMADKSRADFTFIICMNDNHVRNVSKLLNKNANKMRKKHIMTGNISMRGKESDNFERDIIVLSYQNIEVIFNILNNPKRLGYGKSVNIYVDELMLCVDGCKNYNTINNIPNLCKFVEDNMDSLHSNIVAYSTPNKPIPIKNYMAWHLGKETPHQLFLKNALMNSRFISSKMPYDDEPIKKTIDYNVYSEEQINTEILGNFLKL